VTYLALTANLELSNIVVGVLIASGLVWLLRPEPHPLALKQALPALGAAVRYVVILAYDLIASGIQVALLVLSPALPIKPGIVAIPSECDSELGTALSAHAITLTPGELVLEMDEQGVMYTHCLDATEVDIHVASAQKMRGDLLDKIFP